MSLACFDQGWTPLMSVVSAGREEAVDLLLGTEIDVNAKNSSGQTALHYAVHPAQTCSRKAKAHAGTWLARGLTCMVPWSTL